ncbi:MAG: tripartite tricarboxylate transporter substrate binding protein [Betaproteobacteria bacterium]|nr:tripartite tricarboxylate transporter substrate binding protein [Betaproteobacteria bacterium]
MFLSRAAIWAISAGMLILGGDPVFGQDKYPGRLIRIVTATPGSNHDWGARLVAQELTPRIGQRVIVENRGSVAVEYVAREAPPDGYTLLFYGAFAWLQPLLTKVNWDPLGDLAPVSLAMSSPNVLVVHPSLPVKSVKELIALAKARPGDLNYSAGGGGSTPHIAAELFKYMAGVDVVRVHYKGSGPSMIGLLVGEVHLMFAALGPVLPHVKQGKVRPIAVSTPRRTPLMPDLPAVAETLPGYASEATIGFFVPRKTSPAIVNILNREIVQSLKTTDPRRLAGAGVEVVGNSPEEFAGFIKTEMARMGEVIRSGSFTK